MRFYLITDNCDAKTGMRLAGIEGVLVNTPEECKTALSNALNDSDNGIILITQGLYAKCASVVDEFKKEVSLPLITEIPDNGTDFESDAITRYVIDAVGIA